MMGVIFQHKYGNSKPGVKRKTETGRQNLCAGAICPSGCGNGAKTANSYGALRASTVF
ncbi:hypothetical protein NNO_1622 [Hydrogenimonas sp.]|nr:hypothetical protein NNO_1622 [Hydrogenimonas sp.]